MLFRSPRFTCPRQQRRPGLASWWYCQKTRPLAASIAKTSFGAWVNLLVLTFLARRRGVLVATTESWRAAAPIVVAALAAAAGFSGGKVLGAMFAPAGTRLHDEVAFLVAAALGGAAYALVVSLARKRLPLFEPRAPTT